MLRFVPHLRCRFHLGLNIQKNLRSKLKGGWPAFMSSYRRCMQEPSTTHFEELWAAMMTDFPLAADYMKKQLYSCKTGWAACWTNQYPTMGAHSTQRVESQNSMIKRVRQASFPLVDLFQSLEEISAQQSRRRLDVLSNDEHIRMDHDCPVYNDAALSLTRHAAVLVSKEGQRREFYDVCWLPMRPDIDWQADIDDLPHHMRYPVDNAVHWSVSYCVDLFVACVVGYDVDFCVDSHVHYVVCFCIFYAVATCCQASSTPLGVSSLDNRLDSAEGGWLVTLRGDRAQRSSNGGQQRPAAAAAGRLPSRTHLPHWVRVGRAEATCSNCHFAGQYLLPCRHIMAVNLWLWPGRAFQLQQCHTRWRLDHRPDATVSGAAGGGVANGVALQPEVTQMSLEDSDIALTGGVESDDGGDLYEPSADVKHVTLMAAAKRQSALFQQEPAVIWEWLAGEVDGLFSRRPTLEQAIAWSAKRVRVSVQTLHQLSIMFASALMSALPSIFVSFFVSTNASTLLSTFSSVLMSILALTLASACD
jgi:hypothetical protein